MRLAYGQVPDELDEPSNLSRIFGDIETLSLSGTYGFGLGSFRVVSKHVRSVRNLGLDDVSAEAVLRVGEGESIWDLFPNLQCLSLRGRGWEPQLIDVVLRCLREKADAGVKLPRLEIDPLTLEGENPKMFAGVVDEIVVAEA